MNPDKTVAASKDAKLVQIAADSAFAAKKAARMAEIKAALAARLAAFEAA
jgi:hypothetical protein